MESETNGNGIQNYHFSKENHQNNDLLKTLHGDNFSLESFIATLGNPEIRREVVRQLDKRISLTEANLENLKYVRQILNMEIVPPSSESTSEKTNARTTDFVSSPVPIVQTPAVLTPCLRTKTKTKKAELSSSKGSVSVSKSKSRKLKTSLPDLIRKVLENEPDGLTTSGLHAKLAAHNYSVTRNVLSVCVSHMYNQYHTLISDNGEMRPRRYKNAVRNEH